MSGSRDLPADEVFSFTGGYSEVSSSVEYTMDFISKRLKNNDKAFYENPSHTFFIGKSEFYSSVTFYDNEDVAVQVTFCGGELPDLVSVDMKIEGIEEKKLIDHKINTKKYNRDFNNNLIVNF